MRLLPNALVGEVPVGAPLLVQRFLWRALGGTRGVPLIETLFGMLVLDAPLRDIFSAIPGGAARRAPG